MNLRQKIVTWNGVVIAGLMIPFPPYYNMRGLFGGIMFDFRLDPLQWDMDSNVLAVPANDAFLLQLATAVCFTLAFLMTTGKYRSSAHNTVFRIAALIASLVLLVSTCPVWTHGHGLLQLLPAWFNSGYFLLWLRLSGIAFLLLLATGILTLLQMKSPLNKPSAR